MGFGRNILQAVLSVHSSNLVLKVYLVGFSSKTDRGSHVKCVYFLETVSLDSCF